MEINNLSNEDVWKKIYSDFNDRKCKNCQKNTSKKRKISLPQPIPYIGPNFTSDKYKMMFIGKDTYNNQLYNKKSKKKISYFETETVEDLYNSDKGPFWVWVREISSKVLKKKENVLPYLAYTNLLKCQIRKDTLKNPNWKYYEPAAIYCIQKLGWIYKEISYVKPKNVIIFIGTDRDYALTKLFLKTENGELIKKFDFSRYKIKKINKRFSDNFLFVHIKEHQTKTRFILTIHPGAYGTYFPSEMKEIVKRKIITIVQNDNWNDAIDWEMPRF